MLFYFPGNDQFKNFPYYTGQKNGYGYRVYNVHNFQIKINRPVRILFAKEIHGFTSLF